MDVIGNYMYLHARVNIWIYYSTIQAYFKQNIQCYLLNDQKVSTTKKK